MSDYLTHLTARGLVQAPDIRPRLASLFELPPVDLEERPSIGLDTAGDAQPPHGHVLPVPRASSPSGVVAPLGPASGSRAQAGVGPVSVDDLTAMGGGPATPTTRRPRQPALDAPRPFPRDDAGPPVRSSNRASQSEPLSVTAGDKAAASALRTSEGRGQGIAREPAGRVVSEGQEPPAGARPLIRLRPAGIPAEPASVAGPAPRSAQPRVTPLLRQAPRDAVKALELADPRPVIRVTIGRVEVRAVTSQAPPAPRTSPVRSGPALTLEGYLAQRNEGRR
jgi:hypothetical protein